MAEPINTGIAPATQLSRGDGRPVEPGMSRRKALVGALAGTAVSVGAIAIPVSRALAGRTAAPALAQSATTAAAPETPWERVGRLARDLAVAMAHPQFDAAVYQITIKSGDADQPIVMGHDCISHLLTPKARFKMACTAFGAACQAYDPTILAMDLAWSGDRPELRRLEGVRIHHRHPDGLPKEPASMTPIHWPRLPGGDA